MKIHFVRNPGKIWEGRLIPETKKEYAGLRELAGVAVNSISQIYSQETPKNPYGFTLQCTCFIRKETSDFYYNPKSKAPKCLLKKPKKRRKR
jgi:hypothetical protein